ncbi:peptidoglycan-binding protein [Piscinibacter sp. Jin2]|uniref:Peptidoglycan-binding protein n=1 Tax=Aquariibacter lacus TaxID=2801332 RepID=A0A9X0XGZ1_9BURK|nr:glycosyl hydrolase 108 family protein [Piscinibacter lacus]MBL0719788.1 peptidoglycan-binding protein [Piscinibacter lacus]
MKQNFSTALQHTLQHEGGWANHPRDPGGATMKGVTLRTFRRHFGEQRSAEELRNITPKQLETIYRSGYWDLCHCDQLPAGLDFVVFDAAVNSGPGHSARWLQRAVGAAVDGRIGATTLEKAAATPPEPAIDGACDARLSFLRGLGTWADFGKGWGRRVAEVRLTALSLAGVDRAAHVVPTTDFATTKRGSRGVWVERLQAALGLAVDGVFGKDTEIALIAFQAAEGLQPDGVAGRATYRALGLLP